MIDRLQGFFGFTRMPFGRDLAPGMLHRHSTLVPQTADVLATEQDERGRTPVLVFDEAHLLDHAQPESIRMLTNHDMDSTSPFACLLVGQLTLWRQMKVRACNATPSSSFVNTRTVADCDRDGGRAGARHPRQLLSPG